LIRQSVDSVLNQTFESLELIIVDDGSAQHTKEILSSINDPRVKIIPQANDGLSSARNRGMQHAQGDYICFLDADDTRSPWAFAEVARVIDETQAELVLVRGAISRGRTLIEPFLDEKQAEGYDAEVGEFGEMSLADRKAWATSFEPQSANKFISRTLIERGKIVFPNDHFFEDIFFHTMVIAHANSLELIDSRSFTYFQRQLRPQLTASNTQVRFDIIGTARVTFQLFEAHQDFINVRQRGALMIGALRLLRWCEESLPLYHRDAYRVALRRLLRGLDPKFFVISSDTPDPHNLRHPLIRYAKELLA
ncbi:glycosyltransferase, partial [Amphritea balenae]